MVVVRPVTLKDLDQVVHLATLADFGLTTLPRDSDLLRKRILKSQDSFEKKIEEPGGESYLLVMEDLDTGQIVGTSGIVSKVGGFEPFYMYQIKTVVQESQSLQVRKEIRVLHLVAEHNGPCEIGTLFLAPDYRRSGNGSLLSKSRFLFIAEHRRAFAPHVIAEMRGVSDDQGRSPFWEGLGRHFFDIDFPKADHLSMHNKQFIAELMPTHPIYIPLLPGPAQDVIGQVHEKTRPALKILQNEGFTPNGMVDIFDAGPIVCCPSDEIYTVKKSKKAPISEISTQEIDAESFIITNARREFRACLGPVHLNPDGSVRITHATAWALNLKANHTVRFAPSRPSTSHQKKP